jgi:hypothetical protein
LKRANRRPLGNDEKQKQILPLRLAQRQDDSAKGEIDARVSPPMLKLRRATADRSTAPVASATGFAQDDNMGELRGSIELRFGRVSHNQRALFISPRS